MWQTLERKGLAEKFDFKGDTLYRYKKDNKDSEELTTLKVKYSQELIDVLKTRLANNGITYVDNLIGVRETINNVDADKFWMLLLFIYDYSYHYYMEGIDMGESPNEQLLKFTKAIIGNVESFDEARLTETIKKVMNDNSAIVAEYKSGKIQVLGFLIGATRKSLPEAKDVEQIRNLLTKMLE